MNLNNYAQCIKCGFFFPMSKLIPIKVSVQGRDRIAKICERCKDKVQKEIELKRRPNENNQTP